MEDPTLTDPIETARLVLRLVTEADAADFHPLLDDVSLHTHTGGRPRSEDDLRTWFAGLESRASPDGAAGWLTWTIRQRDTGDPVGYVQATTTGEGADLAWVVGRSQQQRGFATEAASAVIGYLAGRATRQFSASIDPSHSSSQRVAERLGLRRTGAVTDGEEVWTMDLPRRDE